MKKRSRLWTTGGVMLAVSLTAAVLLTLVHEVTKKPIQEARERLIAESIKNVIATEFDNDPFAEKITVRRDNTRYTLYPARNKGYVTSIVMQSSSNKGFGGRMDVIVGFLLDGTVSGYKVIAHKETPGLGSKVGEAAFQKNVIGRSPALESFKLRQDGGEVDAVTGATISSRALLDAIQRAYRGYLKFNAGKDDE